MYDSIPSFPTKGQPEKASLVFFLLLDLLLYLIFLRHRFKVSWTQWCVYIYSFTMIRFFLKIHDETKKNERSCVFRSSNTHVSNQSECNTQLGPNNNNGCFQK